MTGTEVDSNARLGPAERAASFERLGRETFDVVVIGGGVVGAGAALDAVTRGLSVALVEARDLASGTSSRSSKLFHGGLRYLEMFEFGLVREALRERELMLTKICPHLAKPVSFLYPLSKSVIERPYVGRRPDHVRHHGRGPIGARAQAPDQGGGAAAGTRPAPGRPGRRHPLLRRAGRRRAAHADRRPHGRRLRGGDPDVDPGGRFLKESDRVAGVRVRDVETGRETDVKARVVINSTGVWTDELQRLSGGRGRFRVRASKGVHLVVPRDRITSESGIILKTEKSVLFVIPWKSHWIIGTTDTDWNLDLAHPAATKADIDYILDHVNKVLAVPLTHDDIEGVYAGLRPLLAGESEQSSKLSREHAVARVGARPDRHRRRQVHHLPGDGRGRGRGRRRGPARPDQPVLHRGRAAGRRGRATRRWSTRPTGWPRSTACTPTGSGTCSTGTARRSTRCWRRPPATTRHCCNRFPGRATTCRPRRCTR